MVGDNAMDGFEMSATTEEGPRPIRVAFPEPVSRPGDVRHALVDLAKQARSRLGVEKASS